MHHFFMLAESRKEIGCKLEEVNQLYERAAHLAVLAAPYRHRRLSAVKLADPNAIDGNQGRCDGRGIEGWSWRSALMS